MHLQSHNLEPTAKELVCHVMRLLRCLSSNARFDLRDQSDELHTITTEDNDINASPSLSNAMSTLLTFLESNSSYFRGCVGRYNHAILLSCQTARD